MLYRLSMREHLSDGAKRHDHVRSSLKRVFTRYGAALSVVGFIAAGCAAQDDGDEPGGGSSGAHNNGGSAAAAGSSGAGGANSGAGTSNSSAGSAGKGGSTSNGGTGGTADGGSAGKGGSAGAAGAGGSGGAAGMGGKGGSGGTSGTGGSAGAGGKGGSGGSGGMGGTGGSAGAGGSSGAPGDACTNQVKDGTETDVDCGGVCATKCATGKGCKTLSDCVANDVCEASKCAATGCSGKTCAYLLSRFIIGSGAKGQVVVTWDSDSLDLDFLIEDTTPFDDSALNWQDDSVEVYLDLNHAKTTAYETDDFQITIPRNAGALSGGTGTNGNLSYNAIVVSNRKTDATGYSLSVSIPYSALNGAGDQTGKTIGFDIAVNDDTNGGDTREGQSMLYGSAENYHDTSQFGALTLTP
jgi:hypothetical protein